MPSLAFSCWGLCVARAAALAGASGANFWPPGRGKEKSKTRGIAASTPQHGEVWVKVGICVPILLLEWMAEVSEGAGLGWGWGAALESQQGPTASIRGWFVENPTPSCTDYLMVEQRGFMASALGLLLSCVVPWPPKNYFVLCESTARKHIPDNSTAASLTRNSQGWWQEKKGSCMPQMYLWRQNMGQVLEFRGCHMGMVYWAFRVSLCLVAGWILPCSTQTSLYMWYHREASFLSWSWLFAWHFSPTWCSCRCNLYSYACSHLCISHHPKSISPWWIPKFSFTPQVFPCADRGVQAGLRQLRTQQLCTRVPQQGFLSHVHDSRTQPLLSGMPQQHFWCLRHREHPGEAPAQKAVPTAGFTEQQINQLLRWMSFQICTWN